MAEARSATRQPRVGKVLDGDPAGPTWEALVKAYVTSAKRRYYRTRNSIRNGMWPTSLSNLCLVCTIFFVIMLLQPQVPPGTPSVVMRLWRLADQLYLPQSIPLVLRAAIISSLVGFAFVFVSMYIRQWILRILLAYRGWMYGSMRSPPLKIKLWGLMVRLFSGYNPSLYSFQRSLPRQPVPPLRETLVKLFDTLRPLCDEEELALFKKQSREFESTLGPKLQKLLILKSWLTQNYVTDWWEKYVYLRSRLPLPNNCNYYVLDQSYWKATDKPVPRAAALLHNIMKFKRLVDREELPPLVLRNTIPICMAQYEKMFSTTRIPGEDMDELAHYDTSESKHVIIVAKGLYYTLQVYDAENQILSAKKLEEKIQWIANDAEKHSGNVREEERRIAALTGLERTEWAGIRKRYLTRGVNNESRDLVERAICCLWLVDHSPDSLTDRANITFNGDGSTYWFDKCFNLIVFSNGRCGLNCEHSLADAPAYAHMWEFTLCRDVLECTFDDDGTCFPPLQTFKQAAVKQPMRLLWSVDDEFAAKINAAHEFALKQKADIDLLVVDHNQWGKGEIKKCKISPDAFVQLALQMAYYKENCRFVQTYEASMTRLYLNGRTETVRSASQESREFVLAMFNKDKDGRTTATTEEKVRLLNAAADKHTNLYKDAMNGKGIDRHLFALYVACKGLGHESDFLQNILTRPWTLSTSQTPHTQQTNVPDPNYKNFNDKLCPGGGFGPVSDEGYGCSYMFPNEHRMFFHISSKRSCATTDSGRFAKYLIESLNEIRLLFVTTTTTTTKTVDQ